MFRCGVWNLNIEIEIELKFVKISVQRMVGKYKRDEEVFHFFRFTDGLHALNDSLKNFRDIYRPLSQN